MSRRKFSSFIAIAYFLCPGALFSADPPKQLPIAIVNVASVNRLIDRLEFGAEIYGQSSEFSAQLQEFLKSTKDIADLDRDRPFGCLIFANLFPEFSFKAVVFGPCQKPENFQTFAVLLAGSDSAPSPTFQNLGEDRYTVTIPAHTRTIPTTKQTKSADGSTSSVVVQEEIPVDKRTVNFCQKNDYFYLSAEMHSTSNTEVFPELDPTLEFKHVPKLAAQLAEKHDLTVAFFLDSIPRAQKQLLREYLSRTIDTEIQQRDNEPAHEYQFRKTSGKLLSHWLDLALDDVQSVQWGLNFDRQAHQVALDLNVQTARDGALARALHEFSAPKSRFAGLINQDSQLSLSASFNLSNPGKQFANSLINLLEHDTTPSELPKVQGILRTVRSTIDAGHVDLFARIAGKPAADPTLLCGIRFKNGEDFATDLSNLLNEHKASSPEITPAIASHNGLAIHRVADSQSPTKTIAYSQSRQQTPEEAVLFNFEHGYSIFTAIENDAAWLAMGGDNTLDHFKSALDHSRDGSSTLPFHLRLRPSLIISLLPSANPFSTNLESALEKLASETEQPIEITLRASPTGLNLRMTSGESFAVIMLPILLELLFSSF